MWPCFNEVWVYFDFKIVQRYTYIVELYGLKSYGHTWLRFSLFFFHMPLHINFPDQMHMWQQFARLCNAGRLAMWLPSWQVGSSMLKCPFKNNQRTHVRFLFFQPWCDYNSSQPLKMKKDVHRESNSVDLKCRSNGKSRKKNIRKPTKPAITMTRHFWW